MGRHPTLTKILVGGAALVAAGTAAQSMGVGSASGVFGTLAAGPIASAISGLLGLGGGFAGGWLSNRFHDKYKALEYELNDPSDVLRNHYLRRLVVQAIRLGIRQAKSTAPKHAAADFDRLESMAAGLFERETEIAVQLSLSEPEVERFFTGRWEDFDRVPKPGPAQWLEFLEDAAGAQVVEGSLRLAVDASAQVLTTHFPALLFDNAKVARDGDSPAFAALQLMLIRSLAVTLRDHGDRFGDVLSATSSAAAQLTAIRGDLEALRNDLQHLPSALESRVVLPDLRPFPTLHTGVRRLEVVVPSAVAQLDSKLTRIESVLRATHAAATEARDILVGDRQLIAPLPDAGDSIRDHANRDWVVRSRLSAGTMGCVVLADHRGQQSVFKVCAVESSARTFNREVEAATTLFRVGDGRGYCRIIASKLPARDDVPSATPPVLPPYWIQMEYFPLGNLMRWWRPGEMPAADRPRRAGALSAQIARTVHTAHMRGIVHRDIKPANILMREDTAGIQGAPAAIPCVADFGISSFSDPQRSEALHQHASQQTVHSRIISADSYEGTLLFMAPELYERSADDRPPASPNPRTDVYAIGVLLYWLLTGQMQVPDPARVREAIDDPVLSYIVRRATHRDAGVRYHSAADLAADLDEQDNVRLRLVELNDALLTDTDRLESERARRLIAETARAAAAQKVRFLRVIGGTLAALAVFVGVALVRESNLRGRAESATTAQEKATKRAEAAEADAIKKQAIAVDKANELERKNYESHIIAAEAALDRREIARARRQLELCAEKLRNWEWSYLDARRDNSVLRLDHKRRAVDMAQFSPDSRYLVVAAGDACIWDLSSGTLAATLHDDKHWFETARFSHDGTRVLTTSGDETVAIWEVSSGRQLFLLAGPAQHYNEHSAAFSPDDHTVVTVSDHEVSLWNSMTGARRCKLEGHTGQIHMAGFSPDSAHVITASGDGTARVWNSATGLCVRTLKRPKGGVWWAEFSPDGRHIAMSGWERRGEQPTNSVEVFDAESGDLVRSFSLSEVDLARAVFSADGRRLVAITQKGSACVWNLDDPSPWSGGFVPKRDNMVSMAISPDAGRAATILPNNAIRIMEPSSGRRVADLNGTETYADGIAYSPDGRRVAAWSSYSDTVRVWDAANADNPRLVEVADWIRKPGDEQRVSDVVLSPDGRYAAVARSDEVRILDTSNFRVLMKMDGFGSINSLSFSTDGRQLLAATYGCVVTWDAATGEVVSSIRFREGDDLHAANFSPSGRLMVTADRDGDVQVWETAFGTLLGTYRTNTSTTWSARFSPDERLVAIAGTFDAAIKVWDLSTGEVRFVGKGGARDLAFSPDGRSLGIANNDLFAQVVDVATGSVRLTLRGHEADGIDSIIFSPDGTRIVTGGQDQTARVWDASTGVELIALRGHESFVTGLSFSADGKQLATLGYGRTPRIWNTEKYADRFARVMAGRAAADRAAPLVAGALRRGGTIEEVRREAMKTAATLDDGDAVNAALFPASLKYEQATDAAWPVVRFAPVSPLKAQRAADQLCDTVQMIPNGANGLRLLGMALYRVGEFQEAIDVHDAAERAFAQLGRYDVPSLCVFRAMSLWQLGRKDEARETLARFHAIADQDEWRDRDEVVQWRLEAETLICE